MLRGLKVRQGFMVAEALLGAFLIIIAIAAMRDLMKAPIARGESNDPVMSSMGPVMLKNPIGTKAEYANIVKSGLFGDAGRYRHNFKPPKGPKKVDPIVKEPPTELPLVLKGTLNAGVTNPFSSATIEIKEENVGQKTFFIGDQVIKKVFLREVRKKEILLENNRKNPKRMEVLKHVLSFDNKLAVAATKDKPKLAKASVTRTARGSSITRVNTKMVTLNRKEIVEKLNRDYEKLASTLDVIEKKDENGKLIGLTVPDIESIPVANDLGFKNGDILTSINNEPVTSQEQVASLANKYQNAAAVRIGFIRNNQPMTILYRLR